MAKQIIIIGAGQGGLSAAIHARLTGAEVLVLEASDSVGGKAAGISQLGFKLDPGPSIIILPRIYEAVFQVAGRNMSDYLRFKRLDPFTRVYFGGNDPIDLPANVEDCMQVLEQFAPEDAASFRCLMDKLRAIIKPIDRSIFSHPYDKFWQLLDPKLMSVALRFDVRKSYRELVDSFFSSPLLKAFFYGFPSYGGQTYDSKAAGALLIPYLMLDEGVFYPEGGVSSIPEAFHKLAVDLGVEFRFGAKVSSLNSVNRRITSILLDTGEKLEADTVISNVDRLTTRSWLGHSVDWQPSLSYFTVHWGIKKRINGLSHHTLLVPEAFQSGFEQLYRESIFPEKPIVYLNATAIEDDQVAPPGCENLFAVITSPAKESHLDWERDRDRYVRQTRQAIREFGFEWDDADIEFERVQTPNYFEENHGNYRGSLYGPHERHRLFGILPLRNYDEEYQNLYYCGGSVQPGAGLPMVTLSGKFAAQAATKR